MKTFIISQNSNSSFHIVGTVQAQNLFLALEKVAEKLTQMGYENVEIESQTIFFYAFFDESGKRDTTTLNTKKYIAECYEGGEHHYKYGYHYYNLSEAKEYEFC